MISLKNTLIAGSLLAGALVARSALAAPTTYDFKDQNNRNTAAFVLDAPFESINAVANAVEGSVSIDDKGKASGTLKVRVESIKTGNETRDGHLQNDKWLDAKKYPFVEFAFKDVALPADFKSGKPVSVKTTGDLTVHGVKKAKAVEVKLQYFPASDMTAKRLPGNLVRVKSSFEVNLPEHGVAQSDSAAKALIGLKVGETANVTIDFFGTDAPPK